MLRMSADNSSVLMKFIPATPEEMKARNWQNLDVLFISGDAYIDHPSFGISLLARFLDSYGFKTGIISQPRFPQEWSPIKDFPQHTGTIDECLQDISMLGRPKYFAAVSSGVVDSMINNYTANKKFRRTDEYSEDGKGGKRPDRASEIYCRLCRLAFRNLPIITGGTEVAMRRLAHYDYWDNRIYPSILQRLDSDLIIYGMAEYTLLEICRLFQQDPYLALFKAKKLYNTAYLESKENARKKTPYLLLPSYEEIKNSKKKFMKSVILYQKEFHSPAPRITLQEFYNSCVIVNPPSPPLSVEQLDYIYNQKFTRAPHFLYKKKIPAEEMIRFSITSHRGCFGGCTFCSIAMHHGKHIQSRSINSILNEISKLTEHPLFRGNISDIGGPTANMYGIKCKKELHENPCLRSSCLFPDICRHLDSLNTDGLILLKKVSKLPKIKKIFIASGIRYDLALLHENYLINLIENHISGQIKTAPEHVVDSILKLMGKPSFSKFELFQKKFLQISKNCGKKQYIIPYFMSNFPGCTDEDMKQIQKIINKNQWNLQQVQSYIPLPMTIAGAMYYTNLNFYTNQQIYISKNFNNKKKQQKLLQPKKKL